MPSSDARRCYVARTTMPRYIGKIDDRYFEFSTIVDAPVTYLMTREEYEAYYRSEYGNSAMDKFAERMERADRKGTSSVMDDSFEDMISCNRYGDGESCLSVDEFRDRIKQETEANADSST